MHLQGPPPSPNSPGLPTASPPAPAAPPTSTTTRPSTSALPTVSYYLPSNLRSAFSAILLPVFLNEHGRSLHQLPPRFARSGFGRGTFQVLDKPGCVLLPRHAHPHWAELGREDRERTA